jgi:hypothetical protein
MTHPQLLMNVVSPEGIEVVRLSSGYVGYGLAETGRDCRMGRMPQIWHCISYNSNARKKNVEADAE